MILTYSAYKEEQKGKKEAAASDKRRRQVEAMAQQAEESVPMDQVQYNLVLPTANKNTFF